MLCPEQGKVEPDYGPSALASCGTVEQKVLFDKCFVVGPASSSC